MANVLITGANRGIGLELTKRLLKRGDHVFAGARNPQAATELRDLKDRDASLSLTVLPLDVTKADSIDLSVKTIRESAGSLDVVINNAGIFPKGDEGRKFAALTPEPLEEAFRVNTVGPLMLTQALADLLAKGAKIINISSQMGSIHQSHYPGSIAYAISKAALNMASRKTAAEFADRGIITIALHPGWVRTDMGGSNADISVDESAEGILKVLDGMKENMNGGFYNWKGEEMPW